MKVVAHRELRDLRLGDDHALFATIFRMLSFDVSKSTRNGEPSRNDSMGSQNKLLLHAFFAGDLYVLNGLSLVDPSSILDNSLHLIVFVRTVVSR